MQRCWQAHRQPGGVDLEALKVSEAEGLLSQLVMQRARLQQHSDMALDLGDIRVGVLVERQITTNLELVSKLLGQLVHVSEHRFTSVLLTPDYIELRHAITGALREHPEAAKAVSAALHALETRAASEVEARPMLAPPVTVKAETMP